MSSKKETVKKALEAHVLPSLQVFLCNNLLITNIQDRLKGELHTLMRRHIPDIIIGSTLNKKNIDTIYYHDNSGEIYYINFLYNFGGSYNQDDINLINECLEEMDFNFSDFILKMQFSQITSRLSAFHVSQNSITTI